MLPLLLIFLLPAQVARPVLPHPQVLDTLDLSDHTVVLSVDDGYHSVYENVYPLIRQYGMTITLAVIGGCVAGGQPSYRPQDRFMNRAEIQELIDSCGIEIASHTMDHVWLTLVDSATAWRQISGSKRYLESLFSTEVITFVYPYGDMNSRARRMVRRAGYRLARAVRAGTPDFWADPYTLPEVELRTETGLPSVVSHIRRNKVTILLLHRIVREPQVFTEWGLADFAALLGWLHSRQVQVVSLSELYREWWREKLVRTLVEQLSRERREPDRLFENVDVDATQTLHSR